MRAKNRIKDRVNVDVLIILLTGYCIFLSNLTLK